MSCCGDREKGLGNVAEDQKWDYIVRVAGKDWEAVLTATEPLRLQVDVMLDALLLRMALVPCSRLLCRIRRRCLHRRQPPRLQQVV